MAPTDCFELLSPLLFPSPQHVRDFVAGDAFDGLMRFVEELVESENGHRPGGEPIIAAARSPGSVLAHDLRLLARAAARGNGVPQGPGVEPNAEDLSPFLDDVVALTRAAAEFDNEDALASLTELVTEMMKAHADPPGEGEKKTAFEALSDMILAKDPKRVEAALRRFPDPEAFLQHLERFGRDETEGAV
ncbi:MAG TPA: hypothetical protein VKM54_24170 [Myxococcota bacterium]|nr:hypothetical protein [Myxococcota bacterium]